MPKGRRHSEAMVKGVLKPLEAIWLGFPPIPLLFDLADNRRPFFGL